MNRRFAILLLLAATHSCTSQAPWSGREVPDLVPVLPGVGVGDYTLGRSTLEDIFGQDTPEMRDRFRESGLEFQFHKGGVLAGVTVLSLEYATPSGLRVGDPVAKVEALMGPPRSSKVELQPKGFALPAMVYPGITFYLADDEVWAISVVEDPVAQGSSAERR